MGSQSQNNATLVVAADKRAYLQEDVHLFGQ